MNFRFNGFNLSNDARVSDGFDVGVNVSQNSISKSFSNSISESEEETNCAKYFFALEAAAEVKVLRVRRFKRDEDSVVLEFEILVVAESVELKDLRPGPIDCEPDIFAIR